MVSRVQACRRFEAVAVVPRLKLRTSLPSGPECAVKVFCFQRCFVTCQSDYVRVNLSHYRFANFFSMLIREHVERVVYKDDSETVTIRLKQ